jgi:hypothetical protein
LRNCAPFALWASILAQWGGGTKEKKKEEPEQSQHKTRLFCLPSVAQAAEACLPLPTPPIEPWPAIKCTSPLNWCSTNLDHLFMFAFFINFFFLCWLCFEFFSLHLTMDGLLIAYCDRRFFSGFALLFSFFFFLLRFRPNDTRKRLGAVICVNLLIFL